VSLLGSQAAHILIDCGVHARGDLGIMPQIAANIAASCGDHLNLIIATHAHQDHVSGFSKAMGVFQKMKVDEVWLPWTEDPTDTLALRLRKKRTALALALKQHFDATGVGGPMLNAVINATGNESAMTLLKSGVTGGKVRYLKAGAAFTNTANIPGLNVRVLGPPTDQKFLSVMDPPVGDRFLRVGAGGASMVANEIRPFPDRWVADPALIKVSLTTREQKDLAVLLSNEEGLAFALDKLLNNTSLVSLLSYGGKNLLFPGDAQYGNWESWMNTPDGESILGQIHFFKIAHHGSHNATPKSALERTPNKAFAAMISTQDVPWPSIPFDKMLTVLKSKSTGYVRSDSIPVASAKKAPKGPAYVAQPGFALGEFWCDYVL